jgi:hypothetical protein
MAQHRQRSRSAWLRLQLAVTGRVRSSSSSNGVDARAGGAHCAAARQHTSSTGHWRDWWQPPVPSEGYGDATASLYRPTAANRHSNRHATRRCSRLRWWSGGLAATPSTLPLWHNSVAGPTHPFRRPVPPARAASPPLMPPVARHLELTPAPLCRCSAAAAARPLHTPTGVLQV